MSKSKKHYKLRLILLRIGSFLASILPLVILMIVKWDTYTATPSKTVKLLAGGVLVAVLIVMNLLHRLKFPNGFVFCVVLLIVLYLLKDLLLDVLIILLLETVGQLIDFLFFSRAIKKTEEARLSQDTADRTVTEMKEVLDEYFGRT